MEEKAVDIVELVLDIGCQPRAVLNPEAVAEYAGLFEEEVDLPAIEVVEVDGDLVVIDGFHRVAGAVQAEKGFIRVKVAEVADLGRARWLASAANQGHGVRRTNADKRQAVTLALQSDIGQEQTLRVIAEHVGVHHSFVAKVRDEGLSTNDNKTEPEPEESPHDDDDKPEPDMYQTAGKAIKGCYRKVCKILGDDDDVCELIYKALEGAQDRQL